MLSYFYMEERSMNNEMWNNLPNNQKNKYKKLITNFASLTEAFTQKSFWR